MRYAKIENVFFKKNREKLVKKITRNSIVIVHSNDLMPKNGDVTYPFRQDSDMFYLSGINQEKSILLMVPGHPDEKLGEILFLEKSNKEIKTWVGSRLSKKEATSVSGVKTVYWLEDFEKVLSSLMPIFSKVYLNLNENPRFSSEVIYKNLRFVHEMKNKYPLHHYERLAPVLTELRLIKEPTEVDLIQHACNITEKAFFRVLRFVKPGLMENEVEAEITHEFTRSGANGHAYEPIIASGENSCILHYIKNNKQCDDGELLLMDFGAEYANYASDCTRTIPINGRFSPRQRECYESVLRIFRETVQLLVPGKTLNEIQEEVIRLAEQEHVVLGLYTEEDLQDQEIGKPLYRKYFMHGVSHFLGLDVHDVGDKNIPLQPGMVVTCEPGIYIEEENIGIRLENDILITGDEPIDLMENIPIEAYEIEKIMQEKK